MAFTTWAAGGTLVYPSMVFDPAAMLRAMALERCTMLPAVPPMVLAMLNHPSFERRLMEPLRRVWLSGTVVHLDLMKQCRQGFGVDEIVMGYGSTESPLGVGWNPDELMQRPEDRVTAGKVMPGYQMKVCAPNSLAPVPHGESGELHFSGPGIIPGYLDGIVGGFYEDADGTHWYNSGDQAWMDEKGIVTVTGRYKDVIIRAGVNIAPAVIEATLNTTTKGVECYVIGVPDDIAGQVPVAVVKSAPGLVLDYTKFQQRVLEQLGRTHVLQNILNLQDISTLR